MSTRQTVTIHGPEERDQIARWARNVEPGTVVTFRKKSRSTEQNAKLHAMLGEVSKQVLWVGQYLDPEDWKDMFTASLRHARVVPGIDKGTYVPLGMHTSTLTIEEMSNLIELIYAFGADPEHPVVFKDPKEHESGSPSSESEADAPQSSAPSATEADGAPSSSASRTPEQDLLIRYAHDLLPMAADKDVTKEAVRVVEQSWAESEISIMSDKGKEMARAISLSVRSLEKRPELLDGVLTHYSDVLECTVEELGG